MQGLLGIGKVDGHNILRLLSRSTQSMVFLISHNKEWFVLKLASHKQYSKSIHHEYQILHTLSHPAIPKVYSFGMTDYGCAYYIMDCVHGVPAQHYVYQKGVPGNMERTSCALRIVRQVAQVLMDIHRNGIAHLDIKSDNVLISTNEQATLLDFGAAMVLNGTHWKKPFHGTEIYASPERLQKTFFDERADIYSLGCLAYRLLSGRMFHQSSSNVRWDYVPAAIRPLLQQMLERTFENRPTAIKVVNYLREL